MANEKMQIAVRVTPKAGRNEVAGAVIGDDGRAELQVRVTAAPEGGKANKAVCEAIARSIGVAKGCVSVVRGATSRHKMVAIDAESSQVAAWLSQWGM